MTDETTLTITPQQARLFAIAMTIMENRKNASPLPIDTLYYGSEPRMMIASLSAFLTDIMEQGKGLTITSVTPEETTTEEPVAEEA
ncbi:MAG: hypothetical protein VXW22_15605 [Pseudomonadota bacterium]|nr:hypothetical protein [Pseudomonadota bacterium]